MGGGGHQGFGQEGMRVVGDGVPVLVLVLHHFAPVQLAAIF